MSITIPMPRENLATLPAEVMKALKVKPTTTLFFEIEDGGHVTLKSRPAKRKTSAPAGTSEKTTTFAQLVGTFPKTKPGTKPATQEDIDSAVRKGLLAHHLKARP